MFYASPIATASHQEKSYLQQLQQHVGGKCFAGIAASLIREHASRHAARASAAVLIANSHSVTYAKDSVESILHASSSNPDATETSLSFKAPSRLFRKPRKQVGSR